MVISIDPGQVRGPVPTLRGVYLGDSPQRFTEEDVARLKEEVGVTCMRFGMEPRQLSDENEEVYHEAGFQYVGLILDWCKKYGVDIPDGRNLHLLRRGHPLDALQYHVPHGRSVLEGSL